MSSNYTKKIKFNHSYDCVQSGCPGHEMFLKVACTSETMSIVIDGDEKLFIEDEFREACKLYVEYALNNHS